jgi:hypothetical protein
MNVATLIITDINADGMEDETFYDADSYDALTDLLIYDLNSTSDSQFKDVALHYWAAKSFARPEGVTGFSFSLSNTRSDTHLTETGSRVKFEYVA